MVRTPLNPQRPKRVIGAVFASLVLFGTACSATSTWSSSDSSQPGLAPADPIAVSISDTVAAADTNEAPPELAFVDTPDNPPMASVALCEASANIWSHSAALNMLGGQATPEMTQIATANVAEWLERATLFDEPATPARVEMFDAFTEITELLDQDFDNDWTTFQASTAYANSTPARTYETARTDLVAFMNEQCDNVRIADLRSDAEARADELHSEFASAPSTVTESDALPGHSIFTHASGRLIASFPSAWSYDEGRSDALADFVASPDIDRFLAGDAIDGVHLQLVEANNIESFRSQLDESFTASTCLRTNDLVDAGAVRMNITQTFECSDHGASIIGQYNEDRGLGLIVEASFDRPDASRADLIRLASIANSALWS